LDVPIPGQGSFHNRGFQSKKITENIKYFGVKLLGVLDAIEESGVNEVIRNMIGSRE